MTHPIQMIGALAIPAITESIYPDSDSSVSIWRDEGGSSSNIYQSVNSTSQNDSTYAKLNSPNVIINVCPTTETRMIRFGMENPSAQPSPYQNVDVYVRSKIVDPYTTGFTATLDIELLEGTTTQRAIGTGFSVNTTFGSDYFSLTTNEINSVTDWDNLYVKATWEVCADAVDADLDIHCSWIYIQFTP
jgi:hypothetical protein